MDLIAAFRVFVRVAEAGSFSAVARELGISQPAVSRQIAALEDHVGERLLQRTTRSLTLTDDGRDLLGHATRVLDALEEAETAVGRRRGTVSGMVRLSVPVTFGRLHLASRLGRLMAAHPGLELDILLNDSMPDLVAEGIDLAIRPGLVADSSLIVRRIGSVSRYILASTDYLERYGKPETPADLAQHNCLIFTAPANPALWYFEGRHGPVSVAVKGRLRSDSGDAIREAVLNGYGIAALPAWYFLDEIEHGRVQLLLREWEIPPTPVHLIYPSRRNLSPRIRVVMDFLLAEFADHPVLAGHEKTR
ncbi:MAG: LysR family transcriptional regulator [Acidocella sp.]|nr:LysR family transcriptional regulator [Acidocella sp.]